MTQQSIADQQQVLTHQDACRSCPAPMCRYGPRQTERKFGFSETGEQHSLSIGSEPFWGRAEVGQRSGQRGGRARRYSRGKEVRGSGKDATVVR